MIKNNGDFPRELGVLGLNVRLKRIVDRLTHETRQLYDELGLDIEPNWHAVLLLLEKHNSVSIAEISQRLGIAHPSASLLVSQLHQRGYVRRKDDPQDGRRQVISLSAKARKRLPKLKRIWNAAAAGLQSAIPDDGTVLLEALDAFENALTQRSFLSRASNQISGIRNG